MGKLALAEGEARGSSPASGGREKDVVNGRRFSIWVPGGASGKRWAVR